MRMDKTTECNYITPCGWCEKWNKKCDLKVGKATIELKMKELEKVKQEKELEKVKQEFEIAKREIYNSYKVVISY